MHPNPVILALDLPAVSEAANLVKRLGSACNFYKVGIELYAAGGMDFVDRLTGEGKEVFLDLKFYDIGETVKRAVAQVASHRPRFLTVHGSTAVMRAAVAGKSGFGLQLLAVTVLTSFDQSDLRDLGYPCEISDLVALRVRNAMAAGVDGIVCSPLEVAMVRQLAGPQAILVTPGVRSHGAGEGDQKRTATPSQAIANGANYLVVGRQVTRAHDPQLALGQILAELL